MTYIIATETDGVGLDQYIFHSEQDAINFLRDSLDNHPLSGKTPKEVVQNYYNWVREYNDNICDTNASVVVFDVRVLINMTGGVMQGASANVRGVEVYSADYNEEGDEVNGDECSLITQVAQFDPELVNNI